MRGSLAKKTQFLGDKARKVLISRRRFYAEIAYPMKNGDPRIAVSCVFNSANYLSRRSVLAPKPQVASMSKSNIQKLSVGMASTSPMEADELLFDVLVSPPGTVALLVNETGPPEGIGKLTV